MITVIDSMMGTGKTTWAASYMNIHPFSRYLYISPYINEDTRIKKLTPGIRMYVPPDDKGPKFPRVKTQLENRRNIATTHALFKDFDEECIDMIRKGKYTLIMDEVIEVINPIENLNKDDIELICNSEAATIDENCKMIWNDKYNNLSKEDGYGKIENLIKLNKIINIDNSTLYWQIPPEIFNAFENVYILTYMFEANVMCNYFKVNNIPYIKMSIKDGQLVDYYHSDPSIYKDLINIYEGKLNTNIKHNDYTLSLSWYKKCEEDTPYLLKIMKNNLYNYFFNITNSKSKDNLWTVFKDYKSILKGKGYTKGFLSVGTRATNNYAERTNLAYCINRFHNTKLEGYFHKMGYPVDKKLYAISDLIQWMWRSAIRQEEPKPINIYIPSSRMRGFLEEWLEGGIRF